jgi:hypothetical protein
MQQVYKWVQGEKENSLYMVQGLSRAIQSGVENHLVLSTSRTKDQLPTSTCSPTASPYLHTWRQKRPSLGSQTVSKHILGNPILDYTGMRCTQLVTWVSMMQMLVTMKRFVNTLGTMPQRSLEVVGEEPTQAPQEVCRGPTQERLETCPRAWPNSLERVS